MREASFFQTTRGRIVQHLKRHHAATAAQLSLEHRVTANAVRQHLARLQREGLVHERSERIGRTKPTLVYSLTPEGERLFPQRYPPLVNAILDEVRRETGAVGLSRLFRNIGRRSAQRHGSRFAGLDTAGRVAELANFLTERGVDAEYGPSADGYVLREHNCPFKDAVTAYPQLCGMVHSLMEEVLPGKARQVASIALGDDRCEFQFAGAQTKTPSVQSDEIRR